VIFNGLVALRLLWIVALGKRKWAVAPESAMASSLPRQILMHSAGAVESSSVSKLDREAVDAVASSDRDLQLLVMTVLSSSSSMGHGKVLLLRLGVG
jgi:hypothetical protein